MFRSKEQQHSFNFPFQCGTNGDHPSTANDDEHKFEENDLMIVGSDGLYDNLYDEDIMRCIVKNMGGNGNE